MVEEINDQSNKITTTGYASFLITLMTSGFLGMLSYIIFSITNIDTYISAIAGCILGFIPLLIFLFIVKHSDDKDILDLNISLFGKPIGVTLNFLLNICILFISIVSLYNIAQFLNVQFMPQTDVNYLKIVILVPIVYASTKNIKEISKISQIIAIVNIVIFIISILGLVGHLDLSAIYPIIKGGIKQPVLSTLVYIVFSTFPIFLLTIIPQNEVSQEEHKSRKIILSYLLANTILIVLIFFTITLLCEKILPMFRYPEYIILKRFEMFSIIERVENVLALQFIFSSIMYQIVSFHFMTKSLKKIFKNNQRENLFPTLIAIIVLISSNFIFKNTVVATNFIKTYFTYIIAIGIFIPMLLTYIALLIKTFLTWVGFVKNNKSSIYIQNNNTN